MFTNDTVTIKCGVTVSIAVDLKALNERTVTAVIWGEVFRFFRSRAARVELKQQRNSPAGSAGMYSALSLWCLLILFATCCSLLPTSWEALKPGNKYLLIRANG